LRVEREQLATTACERRTKPSVYAHHLLEIARLMQNRSIFEWSKATTVAMARKSQLRDGCSPFSAKDASDAGCLV
jgi:hypothetical protein